MKGQPLRPEVAEEALHPYTPANQPIYGAFQAKKFGTMEAVGIKKVELPVDTKPPPVF